MHAKRHSSRGFTLIELLVVIVIIAILASLLLPSLSRAKAAAQSAKCKSNLKQLALGIAMYVHDYDGAFPMEWGVSGAFSLSEPAVFFWGSWQGAIARYVDPQEAWMRGDGVFRCPAHKASPVALLTLTGNPGNNPGQVNFLVNSTLHQPSYGYNAGGGSRTGLPNQDEPLGLGGLWRFRNGIFFSIDQIFKPTREASLKNPAQMLALGDGYTSLPGSGVGVAPFIAESHILSRGSALVINLGQGLDLKTVKRRHASKLNMAFSDGHVESDTVEKWFFSTRDEDLRLWNTDNQPH